MTQTLPAVSTFREAPARARAVVLLLLTAAVVLPLTSAAGMPELSWADAAAAVTLLAAGAADIELGRMAEGERTTHNRVHKGLSAWPYAAALVLPGVYAAALVPPLYALARRRGMRLPLWKWVGSGAILVLGALAADATLAALTGSTAPLPPAPSGLAAALAAALAMLGTVAGGLWAVIRLNQPEDGVFLAALRGRDFYLTEAGVLATGLVTAVVWAYSPAFLLAMLPMYALLQRAVLHKPLQEQARTDAKTGLGNFGHWQRVAERELSRTAAGHGPLAVLIADLDHFKRFNDRHGHLAGDEALRQVAAAMRLEVRDRDLVGRFGGEEFCVLLPHSDARTAVAVAERLRRRVAETSVADGERLTVSIGICVVPDRRPVPASRALLLADRALYRAKRAGRNCVRVQVADEDMPAGQDLPADGSGAARTGAGPAV